jgi:hypothetical protein
LRCRSCYLQIGILWLYSTYLYSFSSCLSALVRNSRIMLNRSGESGHPCRFPHFRGSGFSFFPLSMMLAICLSYIAFIMLRYIPSIHSFLKDFCHEMMLNFIRGFFCIHWDDQGVFVFASVNVLYYVYWFAYVETPLHPWDEADLVMVNDLSDMMLDLVCQYFIENFCINIH